MNDTYASMTENADSGNSFHSATMAPNGAPDRCLP